MTTPNQFLNEYKRIYPYRQEVKYLSHDDEIIQACGYNQILCEFLRKYGDRDQYCFSGVEFIRYPFDKQAKIAAVESLTSYYLASELSEEEFINLDGERISFKPIEIRWEDGCNPDLIADIIYESEERCDYVFPLYHIYDTLSTPLLIEIYKQFFPDTTPYNFFADRAAQNRH